MTYTDPSKSSGPDATPKLSMMVYTPNGAEKAVLKINEWPNMQQVEILVENCAQPPVLLHSSRVSSDELSYKQLLCPPLNTRDGHVPVFALIAGKLGVPTQCIVSFGVHLEHVESFAKKMEELLNELRTHKRQRAQSLINRPPSHGGGNNPPPGSGGAFGGAGEGGLGGGDSSMGFGGQVNDSSSSGGAGFGDAYMGGAGGGIGGFQASGNDGSADWNESDFSSDDDDDDGDDDDDAQDGAGGVSVLQTELCRGNTCWAIFGVKSEQIGRQLEQQFQHVRRLIDTDRKYITKLRVANVNKLAMSRGTVLSNEDAAMLLQYSVHFDVSAEGRPLVCPSPSQFSCPPPSSPPPLPCTGLWVLLLNLPLVSFSKLLFWGRGVPFSLSLSLPFPFLFRPFQALAKPYNLSSFKPLRAAIAADSASTSGDNNERTARRKASTVSGYCCALGEGRSLVLSGRAASTTA